MVLESTMLCVDNSEYMRNGDFPPDRLEAQQQAATLIVHCKLKSNPENTVGLLAMADHVEVLTTLTQDNSKIFVKLHQLRMNGESNFLAGIRVAHLALKHRQNRNHRTRIVVFVGSPVNGEKSEFIKLAKKLKKEKVNVDVICFGEQEENSNRLSDFVETLNGEEGSGSHLMMVPAGSSLQDALINSPIIRSDDGSLPVVTAVPGGGYDFGIDPNEDPELAMALRVSLEEQRQRQERAMQQQGAAATATTEGGAAAVAQTQGQSAGDARTATNLDAMTEEEQIMLALQMSLQTDTPVTSSTTTTPTVPAMNTSNTTAASAAPSNTSSSQSEAAAGSHGETGAKETNHEKLPEMSSEDLEMISDPDTLQAMVSQLPGVDPNSDVVRKAVEETCKQNKKKKPNEDEKDKTKGDDDASRSK